MTGLTPMERCLSLIAVVVPGGLVAVALFLLAEKLLTSPESRRKRAESRNLERAVRGVPTEARGRMLEQLRGAVR